MRAPGAWKSGKLLSHLWCIKKTFVNTMQFNAKVYILEFLHLPLSSLWVFHLLGVSVCGVRVRMRMRLFLSTYPSFCSFFVHLVLYFFPYTEQVYQCIEIRTNGKLTGNGTFFYLERLNMCKLRYSQFHATLVLLSFAKFLDSFYLPLCLSLGLAVVCYTFYTCCHNLFMFVFKCGWN